MYFQLEVTTTGYYSNEANKNKCKNVQLIASTKNNLKMKKHKDKNLSYFVAWTSKYFVAWACCCFKVHL